MAGYDKLFGILKQSASAGLDLVQLRDKKACAKDTVAFAGRVLSFLKRKIPLIINDRPDIAFTVGAAGVHLGQDDLPLKPVRRMLGKGFLIGVSCQTLAHALKAEEEGADYIGFGSVHKTLTKPGRRPMDPKLLEKVYKGIKVPIFAIGGISTENVGELTARGIDRVAVCRDICLSSQVANKTKQFKKILGAV